MEKVKWDVASYKDRAAQIRIVDNGKEKWGHINVDRFQNSVGMVQDIAGECTRGRGFISEASRNDKAHYTGPVESPFAGAAYIFERKCIAPANIDNMSSCVWSEKKRLVASDNRNGNLFGYSVDINGKEGITVVGSMQSSAFGVYQEDPR